MAAGQIRPRNFAGLRRCGLICHQVVATVIDAIDTQDALAGSNLGGRAAGTLAVFLTNVTTRAVIADFADSPQAEAAQYRKKCACRADESAVKAGYHQI